MKLNQVVAIVKGKKERMRAAMTAIHHGWKSEGLSGMARTYKPLNEDGSTFPNENKPILVHAKSGLTKLVIEMEDFIDVIATQEIGNTFAKADIIAKVGGIENVVAADVPVSLLMFLEKQLTDLRTLVEGIPVLPMNKQWEYNPDHGCFVTQPEDTIKTAKVPKSMIVAPATKEHPAQVQTYTADIRIGTWTTVYSSGAIAQDVKTGYLTRINELRDAVQVAREEANSCVVTQADVGKAFLAYIFDN